MESRSFKESIEHVVSYSKGGALLIVLHDGQVVSIVLNPMYIIKGGKYPTAYFKHAVDSDYSLDFTFAGVVALGDAFDRGIVDDFLYILQRIAARQPYSSGVIHPSASEILPALNHASHASSAAMNPSAVTPDQSPA